MEEERKPKEEKTNPIAGLVFWGFVFYLFYSHEEPTPPPTPPPSQQETAAAEMATDVAVPEPTECGFFNPDYGMHTPTRVGGIEYEVVDARFEEVTDPNDFRLGNYELVILFRVQNVSKRPISLLGNLITMDGNSMKANEDNDFWHGIITANQIEPGQIGFQTVRLYVAWDVKRWYEIGLFLPEEVEFCVVPSNYEPVRKEIQEKLKKIEETY